MSISGNLAPRAAKRITIYVALTELRKYRGETQALLVGLGYHMPAFQA